MTYYNQFKADVLEVYDISEGDRDMFERGFENLCRMFGVDWKLNK